MWTVAELNPCPGHTENHIHGRYEELLLEAGGMDGWRWRSKWAMGDDHRERRDYQLRRKGTGYADYLGTSLRSLRRST